MKFDKCICIISPFFFQMKAQNKEARAAKLATERAAAMTAMRDNQLPMTSPGGYLPSKRAPSVLPPPPLTPTAAPPESPMSSSSSSQARSASTWDLPSPTLSMFAVSPRGHSMGGGSVAPRTPGGLYPDGNYGTNGYPDGRDAGGGGDLGALAFFGSLSPTSATPRAQKFKGSAARGVLDSVRGGGDGVDTHTCYEMAEDPASGHSYWFNRSTGHRTWTKPEEE